MTEYIEKWPVVNRLIDLENEFQQYKPFQGFEHAMYRKTCEVEIAIGKTPDADVAPVVHAHWQPYEDTVQCSACGFGTFMDGYFFVHGECTHADDRSFRFSFCPNCGAKMDETVEDDK